ncbi:LysE family translocator [Vreelandella venusta]|uniref:LysE family translocator n=1 Tax=Vreelandella venusta TaxID=44935 RepID=UPI0022854584|nr:LysE family translocator [Halomonas venusta]WAM52952.1 LysE family translocator [Halomonas venusta]
MEEINYLLIIVSAVAAIASPGPATLAIAGASMNHGRYFGLYLAAGVLTGSLFWSTSAAFGLAAILHGNAWLFEVLRYCGAFYLLYLALKSLRSAFNANTLHLPKMQVTSVNGTYLHGLLIHLTNPKPVLFFGSLFSIGVPATANPSELLSVILVVGLVSSSVFFGYAFLFSHERVRQIYLKSKVIFESVFALFFGVASIKLLISKAGG